MSTSYGVLSTYPPTQCGLATFSRALVQSLQSVNDHVGVVRVVDADEVSSVVDHSWVRGAADGVHRAASALNTYDIAIIQHEYGIFPGPDGDEVLAVVRALRVPTITVLHTVLVTPSDHQREILEELVHQLQRAGHDDPDRAPAADRPLRRRRRQRIEVIPHGADAARPRRPDGCAATASRSS